MTKKEFLRRMQKKHICSISYLDEALAGKDRIIEELQKKINSTTAYDSGFMRKIYGYYKRNS